MSVCLRDLLAVEELDLTLVAGAEGLDAPLRCAHTSELDDPTQWLTGGELLLTTGMTLTSDHATQRKYVDRLADAGVAGLGFGIGFGFDRTPPALIEAADTRGLPVVEVPYPVPFIAIAQVLAEGQADARVGEAQASVEAQDRLTALVREGAGPADVLEGIQDLTGAWTALFGLHGEVLARAGMPEQIEEGEVWRALPEGILTSSGPATSTDSGPQGSRLAVPVRSGRAIEGVLVLGRSGALEARDRLVIRHGASVLGLLLAFRRSLIRAERRVSGDVMNEAFAGRLSGEELARRLELVGFPPDGELTVLVIDGGATREPERAEQLEWIIDRILGGRASSLRTTQVGGKVAALMPSGTERDLAVSLLQELGVSEVADATSDLRVGVGVPVPPIELKRSYLAAVFALRAAPRDARVVTGDDLGPYRFLLGGQPDAVLEGFVASVLGPLTRSGGKRAAELVESLRAFVEVGGRWEPGAEKLGIHRHTLRYRIHQAEEILGRDLSTADHQLEILLALKAQEILDG